MLYGVIVTPVGPQIAGHGCDALRKNWHANVAIGTLAIHVASCGATNELPSSLIARALKRIAFERGGSMVFYVSAACR